MDAFDAAAFIYIKYTSIRLCMAVRERDAWSGYAGCGISMVSPGLRLAGFMSLIRQMVSIVSRMSVCGEPYRRASSQRVSPSYTATDTYDVSVRLSALQAPDMRDMAYINKRAHMTKNVINLGVEMIL